ncbi:hypothetical protein OIU84_022052 [Salix udensis]|uniref:Uncharacterized protein n=1 Tax=Salix udensis TaxID=889485 RepID=A0AAD6KN48_9ROSI|nr:hypothetical protein OIU84_022052 [Salix udensis]
MHGEEVSDCLSQEEQRGYINASHALTIKNSTPTWLLTHSSLFPASTVVLQKAHVLQLGGHADRTPDMASSNTNSSSLLSGFFNGRRSTFTLLILVAVHESYGSIVQQTRIYDSIQSFAWVAKNSSDQNLVGVLTFDLSCIQLFLDSV